MKLSLKTTSYYKQNKGISKLHGILFMLVGFIILGFIFYGLIQVSMDFDNIYEDWNSEDYSSDYEYYDDVDCSAGSSTIGKMNVATSSFDTKKSEYESAKNKYYSTSNVDLQLEYHDLWADSFNSVVFVFNDAINAYNEDSLYFDNCDSSASNDIEIKRAYLDNEELTIGSEFQKLKLRAEAEGYIFYE